MLGTKGDCRTCALFALLSDLRVGKIASGGGMTKGAAWIPGLPGKGKE